MTITILENELRKQNISEKDDEMTEQKGHAEISGDSVESLADSNARSPDNENGIKSDELGSIKWHSIRDLKSEMGGVNVKDEIQSITPPRTIKNGAEQVVEVEISDHTGKINLALFNGQIENVKEAGEVYIENGYTRDFQSVNTLYVGKYGKLRIS